MPLGQGVVISASSSDAPVKAVETLRRCGVVWGEPSCQALGCGGWEVKMVLFEIGVPNPRNPQSPCQWMVGICNHLLRIPFSEGDWIPRAKLIICCMSNKSAVWGNINNSQPSRNNHPSRTWHHEHPHKSTWQLTVHKESGTINNK